MYLFIDNIFIGLFVFSIDMSYPINFIEKSPDLGVTGEPLY